MRLRLVLASVVVVAACAEPSARPVRVFAAASLSAVFTELAQQFERTAQGCAVELHFAGTPQLVVQLREGAAADVFASADAANMERVVAAGGDVGEPVEFARNRLCIVTRKGETRVHGLADLASRELRVLLCGPEVPAGRYARDVLQRAGIAAASRSDEPSVRAVLGKVALGEADAGIVYATDAAGARDSVDVVEIPAAQNVTAVYPIVSLVRGGAQPGGQRFVAFVGSPAGRAVLQRHGFEVP